MTFILGIIPARGGSKGIAKKNIALLSGKPLIAHTIIAAKNSKHLNACILSTDSRKIADVAAQFGVPVAGLRPQELATDTASNVDAVVYELKKYEQDHGVGVDVVVLLQPTAPMRTAEDIDAALDIFLNMKTNSLISVYEASFVHPIIMYYFEKKRLVPVLDEGNMLRRRQEYKPVYVRNGALYIATREQIMVKKTFVCAHPAMYIMPRERSVNIDEPFDLELAEWMMGRYERE